MDNFISRWLGFPLWLQAIFLCLPIAVIVLITWWLWSSPVFRQSTLLQSQQQQQSGQYQQRIQRLLAMMSLASLNHEIAQLRQSLHPDKVKTFSLLDMAQASGGEIAVWQPAGQGGNLTLALNWPQVHSVFDYFGSLQTGVELPHFSLKPEQAHLRFQLTLALNHEG